MCLRPSRVPDFTVSVEAAGEQKQSKRKKKKPVLQTLRGHSLSTQDQGQCQRPDVKRFCLFIVFSVGFWFVCLFVCWVLFGGVWFSRFGERFSKIVVERLN